MGIESSISLIAADFDILLPFTGVLSSQEEQAKEPKFYDQYSDNYDCPIFRALKRQGIDVKLVTPDLVELNTGEIFYINGYPEDLRIASRELYNKADTAEIRITNIGNWKR